MNFETLFIDGKWTDAHSSERIEVEDPATLQIIAKVPAGNQQDVDAAVEAASRAFEPWNGTSVSERILIVERAKDILNERLEEILDLEVRELGSPVSWAKNAHVKGPIKRIEHFLKVMRRFPLEEELSKSRILREPIGVVAAITPWNYPLGQIVQKIIPAMLTGNTVVLKPSQNTPLTSYILCDAFAQAGLPAGVLNLVTGRGAEVGNALATHPKVDMVSFTGSTVGGREVSKLALESIKKISLELGGKSPLLVLRGADYETAVRRAMDSVFYNTGQTCAALTRMIVPREDLPQIEKLLIEGSSSYLVGDPKDEKIAVGPLSSRKQFDKVKKYMEIGISEGARLIVGEVPKDPEGGYFVQPSVFTNVGNDMTIAREEIFGPVLCLIPYTDEKEAIRIANDSIYGLSGAVFGPEDKAREAALLLRTGTVYINEGRWDADAPFGGYKQSGIGREGGLFGLEEFVEIKTIFDK